MIILSVSTVVCRCAKSIFSSVNCSLSSQIVSVCCIFLVEQILYIYTLKV